MTFANVARPGTAIDVTLGEVDGRIECVAIALRSVPLAGHVDPSDLVLDGSGLQSADLQRVALGRAIDTARRVLADEIREWREGSTEADYWLALAQTNVQNLVAVWAKAWPKP